MTSKELTSLILRCVRGAFPDANLTQGSTVWTKLINPILSAVGPSPLELQTREYERAIVRTMHPSVDIEKDGEVDDLLLKPSESLLAPFGKEITTIKQRQTIRDLSVHTLESISDLAANSGIIPAEGGYAQGPVRLYFNAPTGERVTPETYMETPDGLRFYATGIQSITASQMTLNHTGDLYYWDIRVIAEKPGVTYNVEAGQVSRAPTLPRVIRVSNLSRFGGGLQRDSVEDVAAKIENFPCTQSIGTRRGTSATVLANLAGVRVLETVGMGDPLMQRDIIVGGEMKAEALAYPAGGAFASVAGAFGEGTPDEDAHIYTRWFTDATTPADFTAAFGLSSGPVDGYYLIACWYDAGLKTTHWLYEKIIRVISQRCVEIENQVIPTDLDNIYWSVVPAQLTLSEIPGGILWPDTPDGEVVIRSDVVHVGGQTDVFLMGTTTEDATTDLASLTDEDLLGYGVMAQPLNTVYYVMVDDMDEITTLGPVDARLAGAGLYDVNLEWATVDLTGISAGNVFRSPADMEQYRVLALRKSGVGGAFGAGKLVLLLDGDTGGDVNPAYLIKRRPMVDLRNACFRLNSAVGTSGYYRVIYDYEGAGGDPAHPVIGYAGCRYSVYLSTPMTATLADEPWTFSDDTDINLSDPKQLRVDGTTLTTFAGSDTVFDPGPPGTPMNFNLYGVVAGDILRIDAGVDAGDYVLREDPFGAGGSFLRLSTILHANLNVRYRIFRPLTPVELPLLAASKLSLLDAGGTLLGVDVPYGEALGAYSEVFTNLGRGERYKTGSAIVGICTEGGIPLATGAQLHNPSTAPMCLWVWHERLGYQSWRNWNPADGYLTDGNGGYYVPEAYVYNINVNYDLQADAPVGWTDFLIYLNGLSPYPFWSYVDEVISGVTYRHLVCRPFGSYLQLLGFSGGLGKLTFPTAFTSADVDLNLDIGAYTKTVESRDVLFANVDLSGLTSVVSLSTHKDLVDITSGPNVGVKDMVLSTKVVNSTRVRLVGYYALVPGITTSARIGLASTGVARVYFKDATDFECDFASSFVPESSTDLVFRPDPSNRRIGLGYVAAQPAHSVLIPGYPTTENPDNGYVTAGSAWYAELHGKITGTESDFWALGVRPGDLVECSFRDIITTRVAWPVGPLGANEVLTITSTDGTVTTATFTAGSTYTGAQAASLINVAFGDTVAYYNDMLDTKIHLRWQEEITIGGSALGGGGVLGAGVPPTNNWSYSRGTYKIAGIGLDGGTNVNSRLYVEAAGSGSAPSASDIATCRMQYRVIRPTQQRWSSMEMEANVGVGGLYYVDVELIGHGVGDSYNLGEDEKMTVSGTRTRGYRLSSTNPETAFSTAEEVWAHIDNYFQPTSVAEDSPPSDQTVFGSGFRLYYERSPLVSSAQALLNSREERDNNQSVLARHLFPYYVNCAVAYAGGALESVVLPEIENLITGRDPNEPLDVSDIIGVVTGLGADHVDTPIGLAVLRHQKDRSLDVLVGMDRVETPRLAGFLPGNITVTRRA
jgi:hypothetical protein